MSEYITVRSEDGTPIHIPNFTAVEGLVVEPNGESATAEKPQETRSEWSVGIRQANYGSSGSRYLHLTAVGNNTEYSTDVLVVWMPVPSFSVTGIGSDKSETETTITHTVHFTVVPYYPSSFGAPTIHAELYGHTCDGGVESKAFTYNGQNQQTLSCVVNKPFATYNSFTLYLKAYIAFDGGDLEGYLNGGGSFLIGP